MPSEAPPGQRVHGESTPASSAAPSSAATASQSAPTPADTSASASAPTAASAPAAAPAPAAASASAPAAASASAPAAEAARAADSASNAGGRSIDIPLDDYVRAAAPHDPEIDLALDGDPEPPPESRPEAKPSVDAGIIAPPAESAPPAGEPPVITGLDQPPGDSTPPVATGPHQPPGHGTPPVATDPDQPPGHGTPRGHWADLEGGYDPDERTSDVITAYPSARPGPSAAIHGVGILVLVTDLERSVAFYRDVLGFFEIDGGPGSAVLASGDTRVVLRTVYEVARDSPRVIYLNLEVGDIDAVYEELKAKGVEFAHAPRLVNQGQKLELWSATFKDPDRHNIAISQWRAAGSTAPHG